ncbi:pre-rRNA-processing protein TSR1 homolog [Cimex lectularius]|uniref:Pre-rRNA-processing protein TSR1 homolog n=1 Tax=Cimex lectularius TaxID=79782 RepID=A0A8I6RSD9_CIMLE|nr:pre-rRNA-processing protein TSR1 homolog [Cimex lectularius]
MGLDTQVHRPTGLKQQNKQHKHWHKSKGSIERINKGRSISMKVNPKTKFEMKREERRNQAQQMRHKKRFEYLEKRRGLCQAPFLVGVIPLNNSINPLKVFDYLKESDPEAVVNFTEEGFLHLHSTRFKQKFTFATVHGDNLFDKLDLLKVCTTLLFLTSVEGVDEDGVVTITSAIAQGLPTVTVVVTDLATQPQKKWHEVKSNIEKELQKWLPPVDKVMTMDKPGDGLNILRKIAFQKHRSILQRDRRPHMLAEVVQFSETSEGKGTLKITGYLRGKNLSVNSLVHISGWGDFQMSQIDAVPAPGDGAHKEIRVLEVADPQKQESLQCENIPDPMDAEQTWPTEEEMEEAANEKKKVVKKVPHGWSDYQAAWIPDCDAFEIESGDEEEEDENMQIQAEDEEMSDDQTEDYETCTVTSEAPIEPDKYDKEMDMDEEKAALEKLKQAKEDKQFPDEVDTPHDIPAKDRFMRYRGLKSFRTSPWDPKENLPKDYARIFQFQNFDRTKAAALAQEQGGAQAGWYVTIHVINVPTILHVLRGGQPIVLYGLLPHENKLSLLNVVLKRALGSEEPIASKEKLLFQVGFRRFKACPIFSQHTNGNKFKYERFFQPDATVVASMYAPVIYPPASVLVFKENKDRTMSIVAQGSVLSVDPNRIVVKRAVLSGHPMKILKRSAVIRFMFFNREDIAWFKPVELRTKYGLRGHIKEPLGTHGHMKCVFNQQLKSQDTVLLNLYKRVFPKWTYESEVNFVPIHEET